MQKRYATIAGVVAAGALGMLTASSALAQATRTWVSGTGDDANPCSRTAPCKTFAGAISKTAPSGEINVLDPGGFGAVTITKAITIDGSPVISGVLVSGTNGIVVAAGANDVVILRGLDIDGLGTGLAGINFVNGKALHVEDCRIYGFTGSGISFAPPGTSDLFVTHSTIRNNGAGGIDVIPNGASAFAYAALDDVRLLGNLRGVRAQDGATVSITRSIVSGSTANGIIAISTTRAASMSIDGSISTINGGVGVYSGGALATVRITNSMVTDNAGVGLLGAGGAIVSFGNNRVAGNLGGNGAPTSTVPQI
jgi:Right handed beta helix region